MTKEPSIYWYNCIREIRQSVYGRDNRKPIADAIEELKQLTDNGETVFSLLPMSRIEAVLDQNIIDWTETVANVIKPNYKASVTTDDNLLVSLISGNDYLLTDNRSGDSLNLISGLDYRLVAGENEWRTSALSVGSYTEYEEVPHYESYTLVVNP